jgi:hypothetical protein
MGDCICVRRGDGPEGCGICNETGTTPDIAGLCERLRDRVAFCKDCGGISTYDEDDCALDTEAADTLERQAAEIERLRGVVSLVSDIFTDMIRNGYVYSGEEPAPFGAYYIGPGALETIFARAALTGEDT